MQEMRIPDIGDAGSVEIIEVCVSPGDQVAEGDPLIVIETDKSSMDVPATRAGSIVSVQMKVGDNCSSGDLIAQIETRESEPPQTAPGADADDAAQAGSAGGEAPATPEPPAQALADGTAKTEAQPPPPQDPTNDRLPPHPPSASATLPQDQQASVARVYAGPAVRRLARELGVNLSQVAATGAGGRIIKKDVHDHVRAIMSTSAGGAGGTGIAEIPHVDFSRFGDIELQPLSRTMRSGATNLSRAWLNLPHVTQHNEADVTDLEAFRESLKPEARDAGAKITLLPMLMQVAARALREFPRLSGSFAGDGKHYVLKRYCHIGFAVDTEEGLLVPVVRDADRKGLFELAREISELADKARSRKLAPNDMQGGCFSISSLGALGGTGFTPIVNAPEVAILGVARLDKRPQWNGQTFVPRDVLPLSLSFDHRAINGAEAGRFLNWYCAALQDMRPPAHLTLCRCCVGGVWGVAGAVSRRLMPDDARVEPEQESSEPPGYRR